MFTDEAMCEVSKIDDNTVLVKCPGDIPFEKTFRRSR